jgi:YVTN family beta-propeller protein
MRFARLQCLVTATALAGALVATTAHAGPLAVVANFTDPSLQGVFQPPWPGGTVSVVDTATDKLVGTIKVGANPQAVAITPDGNTAVVACSQDSELDFIDLSKTSPVLLGTLKVGNGSGDTFYPAGLAISPDGQYVAVTSLVGSAGVPDLGIPAVKGQIDQILLVKISDRTLAQTLSLTPEADPNNHQQQVAAEAAAFTPHGSLLAASPSAVLTDLPDTDPGHRSPIIYALGYQDGQLLPLEIDEETNKGTMGFFAGPTGYNVTMAPDGSFAIVPGGKDPLKAQSGLYVLHIDGQGKVTDDKVEPIKSGGDGPHSVAISADGKFAYVRNLLPPSNNIAVFQIQAGPTLTDTGVRLNCEGIPQTVLEYQGYQPGALGFIGSQMIAVTPDGTKIYAANPFGGKAAGLLGLYGSGNVLVFDPTKTAPIKTLTLGTNPLAIAIQPK